MRIKNTLFIISFIVLTAAHAAEPLELVSALSHCDEKLFSAVYRQRTDLEKITPIREGRENRAYIQVPDRSGELNNVVKFTAPYSDGKLSLTGYFDDISNLFSSGRYYSWGFFIQGTIEDVKRQLTPAILDGTRMRRDGELYVRSELWKDGGWRPDDSLAGGVAPAHGTVERVFRIENAPPDFPGAVRVGCSLQGSVTAELLRTARPDVSVDTEPIALTARVAAQELASLLMLESATDMYRKSLKAWREAEDWNKEMFACMEKVDNRDLVETVADLLENDLSLKELTDALTFMRTDTAARIMKELRAREPQGKSISRSDLDLSVDESEAIMKSGNVMRKIVALVKSPRYSSAYLRTVSATYARCGKAKTHS